MIKKSIALICFVIFIYPAIKAQNSVKTDSVTYAFLPALAFNSDMGFIFGGIVSRYDYKEKMNPYYSFTNISAIISTKGLASLDILIDKPQLFDTEIRLLSNFYASRFLQESYYGLANYSTIDLNDTPISEFYEFQSFSIGLNTTFRYPLISQVNSRQLDILAILNLEYKTPWDNGDGRLITLEKPLGYKGGRTFMLGSGIIWEARDNEFNPTKGTYVESSFEAGNTIWGSSFNTISLKHDMRHYLTFTIIKDITLANRFFVKHTAGDTPYWKLSYAGDNETLRGYPFRRFLDDNVVILNNELRTWLFDFPSVTTRIGGVLFMDVGRTFPNGSTLNSITDDLKVTYGFGGTSSLFTPDFIIRMDIGFSEEDIGVYISIGYLF